VDVDHPPERTGKVLALRGVLAIARRRQKEAKGGDIEV
jgi:hypothetical protein